MINKEKVWYSIGVCNRLNLCVFLILLVSAFGDLFLSFGLLKSSGWYFTAIFNSALVLVCIVFYLYFVFDWESELTR